MSSIDKGVEQVVNRMGRSVRVVKVGNTIYGYIGHERVFSLADRFGYINDREEQIIRDGIRQYDEEERRRRERREAERRAREEAIRRAQEEAERRRREALEAERKAALEAVKTAVKEKREEAQRAIDKRVRAVTEASNFAKQRREAVASLSKLSPTLDFSALSQRNAADESRQRAEAERAVAECRKNLAEVEKFATTLTNDKTTEEYREMLKKCRKLSVSSVSTSSAEYENSRFMDEIKEVERGVRALTPAIEELKGASGSSGEIGIVAKEALSGLSARSIGSAADIQGLASTVENRLSKIAEIVENNRVAEEVGKLSAYHGAVAACKKTQTLIANGTYTANDFREEIEEKAAATLEGFRTLTEGEFSTCPRLRNRQASERLEAILSEGGKGETVLREVEKLQSELSEYIEADALHRNEYEEYLSIVKSLQEYGVSRSEIGAFNARGYSEQKRELSAWLASEKREAERSVLFTTDMRVKSVMEEMGYEQFASVGDAEGYVRESLFTKAGYDGVLWQVITYSNGSVSRRVIGVNKGDTQTDKEYVKEVARELDEREEPQEFLRRFREATGSELAVTEAVEHDSENVDEAIENNGFHYLQGEALELYEEKVTKIEQGRPVKKRNTQVRVTADQLVQSSSRALRQAMQKSRAISRAH